MSGKKASKVMTPQNEAEDEATRRIKARRARQSRRSTQGVTLDNVEEAQKLSAGSVSEKKSELLGLFGGQHSFSLVGASTSIPL